MFAGVLLVLTLAACGSALVPPAAVVGGRDIRTKGVTAALDRFKVTPQFAQAAQQSGPNVVARQFEQTYLARLIRRYVLAARARQMGIVVSTTDVRHALNQIESTFPSQTAFATALKQQGLTLHLLTPLMRDRIVEQRLRRKVTANVAPSNEKLRAIYRQQQDRAWQRWLINAYKAADVNVNPSFGTLELTTQTIVDNTHAFPGAPAESPSPITPAGASPPGASPSG
jgi:hypothetical protein